MKLFQVFELKGWTFCGTGFKGAGAQGLGA